MAGIRIVTAILLGCLLATTSAPSVAAANPALGKAPFDEGQRLFLAGDDPKAMVGPGAADLQAHGVFRCEACR